MTLPEALPLHALEAVANAVVITDTDGMILWVNPSFTRATGYPSEEVIGQTPRLLKSGAHDETFYRQLWSTIRSGNVWAGEMINRRKDGSTYVEEQTITPVRDTRGAISHFIAIKQDVTVRKQAEAALVESEQRYRLLADNVTDVISVYDMQWHHAFVSPSVQRLCGYGVAEAMSQSLEERLTPASFDVGMRVFAEEMAIERSGSGDPGRSRTLELELRCKDGTTVWTETQVSFLRGADGQPRGVIAVSRDIAARKRMEGEKEQMDQQLRQAQKMEAIGRLAGGIAHDFNNLLTVIIGRSQIMARSVTPDDPQRRGLEMIETAAQRATALIRQLLTFSRQQVVQPTRLDLNAVVAAVERLLQRVIGEDIQLATTLGRDLWAIRADPSQIEQILLNLAVNSRDAMPGGGRLTIETANVDLDEGYARTRLGVQPGPYVALSVADTGHGMDTATQARIFEPFFTTKAPGKGAGLGLATVHGIVTQSEGHIWVDSEMGRGTTFRIHFPRAAGGADAAGPGPVFARERRGTERVLLVEDDEQVRGLARQVLEDSGYSVLEAGGPAEALEFAGRDGGIDLLVTDVVMPEMNGVALARRINQMHPETRVLYVSGYTGDFITERGISGEGIHLLQKPFSLSALTTKVREVLDGPGR